MSEDFSVILVSPDHSSFSEIPKLLNGLSCTNNEPTIRPRQPNKLLDVDFLISYSYEDAPAMRVKVIRSMLISLYRELYGPYTPFIL